MITFRHIILCNTIAGPIGISTAGKINENGAGAEGGGGASNSNDANQRPDGRIRFLGENETIDLFREVLSIIGGKLYISTQ